jgi:glutathione reductase (NADPH)
MDEMPKSILIVGGGYIACEFACILNGLGVEVTQYYRGAQILRGFDEEARGLIAEAMHARGIDLHLGTNIVEMDLAANRSDAVSGRPAGEPVRQSGRHRPGEGPVWVKSTNGSERDFDLVMFATGRAPNTADMGLEEAGVRLGRGGKIEVNEYSQSSVPSIYAIGDMTARGPAAAVAATSLSAAATITAGVSTAAPRAASVACHASNVSCCFRSALRLGLNCALTTEFQAVRVGVRMVTISSLMVG